MVTWMLMDVIRSKINKNPSIFVSIPGLCSATVVGLVVVTPGAGYIEPIYSILFGFVGGLVIHLFLTGKKHFFHVDDTLDVFSCHLLGGSVGTLLTGLFSEKSVNAAANNGAVYGNPIQLWYQTLAILAVAGYSAVCTAVILFPLHWTVGIRINRIDQVRGLDTVAHGVIEVELQPTVQTGAKIPVPIKRDEPIPTTYLKK